MATKDMELCGDIERARAGVGRAIYRYSQGASCERVNEAVSRLNDALNAQYVNRAGIVPCGRQK